MCFGYLHLSVIFCGRFRGYINVLLHASLQYCDVINASPSFPKPICSCVNRVSGIVFKRLLTILAHRPWILVYWENKFRSFRTICTAIGLTEIVKLQLAKTNCGKAASTWTEHDYVILSTEQSDSHCVGAVFPILFYIIHVIWWMLFHYSSISVIFRRTFRRRNNLWSSMFQ